MFTFSSALLLVVGFVATMTVTAHGRNIADHDRQRLLFMTSSMTKAAAQDRSPTPVVDGVRRFNAQTTPMASVVIDWSLVCKELCGAGVGGVQCTSHCDAVDSSLSSSMILLPKKDLICRDLCLMQLGDSNCQCENIMIATGSAIVNSSGICHMFCVYNNITLNGCSACSKQAVKENVSVAAADDRDSNAADQAQSVQSKQVDAVSSTTPDWNELCESLCKTGDGGSLCNCDLSPFK